MDFLDPKRKKTHKRRLLVGYFLTAVAIAMATLILLFSAYGFDIDRKTGTVIQNGTVFVDSQPVSADVYLDDVSQNSRTATRLVIPGGQYSLKLVNNGYREWNRTFAIDGGKIERINYPLLIPKELKPMELKSYPAVPVLSSQSNKLRWLLVQVANGNTFELYDLNDEAKPAVSIALPSTLLAEPTKTSGFEVIEWAQDDRHILIKRLYDNKNEYLVLNLDSPASSVNLNTMLGISPTRVAFRNNKSDQFYVFDSNGGVLRAADSKNRTLSGPLLSNVLNFASYGPDIILYATKEGADAGKVNFRIRTDIDTSYLLKSTPDGSIYLLAIGEFGNSPYFVVGTNADDAVSVYKNPLPTLRGENASPLLVSTVMRMTDPQFVSFAPENQFILIQKGNQLKAYDIFSERQYQVELNQVIDPSKAIRWVDTHHLAFSDQSTSYIVDFDGYNNQPLLAAYSKVGGPFLSPNLRKVYSLGPSQVTPGGAALIFALMVSE